MKKQNFPHSSTDYKYASTTHAHNTLSRDPLLYSDLCLLTCQFHTDPDLSQGQKGFNR